MIHYFLHLPKDRQLDFETNYHVSTAIMHTARNALSPFEEYLTTSIETLKKKEDIKLNVDELSKKNISDITLKRYLKILLNHDYISEGAKDGKFKKYYITEKGIELIENSLNKYTEQNKN